MRTTFSVFPLRETHACQHVAEVIDVIEDVGNDYQLGPMKVSVEGNWEDLMSAVQNCVEELAVGRGRAIVTLTVDASRNRRLPEEEVELECRACNGTP